MNRYDSYKDSGVEWIGEIPSEWECLRLGMLGDFASSGIDKKSKENETPVRMVNYTDLIQSRKYYPIQTGEKEYMRVTTPQSKLEVHRLKKGDMVFIPSSETHEDLGYSSLIDFDENDIVYSYHILRYKTKKPVYHYYKKYLINHHSVLNQFSSECKGTTRQIIGRDVFNNVRVVLPPLHEQQQIVSFLDTKTSLIDSLIEKTQRKIELLKEKRTSLINEVVTKGLNPNVEMKDSGVEWIGEIPSSWSSGKIKYFTETISKGTTPSTIGKETLDEGPVIYIKVENIKESTVDFPPKCFIDKETDELLSRSKLIENDILVVITGSTTGKVVILPKEFIPSNTNQGISFIRLKNKSNENVRYFWYWLISQKIQNQIKVTYTQSTQPNLSMELMGNFYIPIPNEDEKTKIVEYLDEQTQLIDNTISIEEKRIELLKEYRQSLISEVVTGKRKVV